MLGNLLEVLKKKNRPDIDQLRGNKNALQFDLLYQLSYMSVIASAGVPRKQIFEYCSKLSCSTAEYFERVELMYQRLKYDYAKSCKLVGETAKEEEIRGLLLRFSNSLISGEPEAEFLAREAEARSVEYESQYTRKIETLKMWTDAYISLCLSAVLVVIVGIVSTMIWEIQTAFIMGLVVTSIFTEIIGIWLIYLISPRDSIVLPKPGSKEQKLARKVFMISLPIVLVVLAMMLVSGIAFGWALIVIAAVILPIGMISMKDDNMISKRDSELGPLLGSLGGICAAIGTTVTDALGRIDLDAIETLKIQIKALHVRLISGIRSRLCWNKFIEETGSELTNRSVGMFYDAIDLGGEPQAAGYNASLFTSKIATLRAKRKSIVTPFRWLCLVMHGAVVALLIFITEVMGIFGNMLQEATNSIQNVSALQNSNTVSSLTSFNFGGLDLLKSMVIPLVIVFTICDAVAPSVAEGGNKLKFCFNLAFTSAITGLGMIALPPLAESLFGVIKL